MLENGSPKVVATALICDIVKDVITNIDAGTERSVQVKLLDGSSKLDTMIINNVIKRSTQGVNK